MSKIERNIKALTQLGLTINQAKVYLALVKLGITNAKEISKTSRVVLQDIYRVMPLLEKIGMVERIVSSPSLFKANSPEQALSALFKLRVRDNCILNKEILRLTEELNHKTENAANEQGESQFSIFSGKELILMKATKAMNKTNDSICVLTMWKSTARNTQNFFGICRRALRRQVKVRFIFYVSKTETAIFLKMKWHLLEDSGLKIRLFCEEKPIIFSVLDKKQVFFSTKKDILGNAPILWSNNPNFAALAQDYFDSLWEKAIEKPTCIIGETVAA
jgi:HTH-type transcriptional regulator, sugar sensing transcriptional regulator